MEELVKRTRDTARREELWLPGDTIVVAVSGGPDSTALLHVLHALAPAERLQIVAAHVDHGFRGAESAAEAEAVRSLCAGLGIPCETVFFDVPAYIEETGMNPQAAARAKRYGFLHEVAERYGAARIALAHHADDQAETVLMRLLRGTGATGLSGMAAKRREKNVELIRPFLRMNKADLIAYCAIAGLRYCTDASNAKRGYFRNRVRLDILPFLEKYNPNIAESLVRLAEISAAEDEYLDAAAESVFRASARRVEGGWKVGRHALLDLPVALQRRLIKLILNYLTPAQESASFERVERIRTAAIAPAPTTWSIDAGSGIRCLREYETLRWTHENARPGDGSLLYIVGGMAGETEKRLFVAETPGELVIRVTGRQAGETGRQAQGRNSAEFDADEVRFPLTVRGRRPGDRMSVMGLNGSKKVQDMFVDEKIAPSLRDRLPLVWDAEGRLLWIPGLRRSSAAPVTAATQRLLRLEWKDTSAHGGEAMMEHEEEARD